jgi:hypothetical protein
VGALDSFLNLENLIHGHPVSADLENGVLSNIPNPLSITIDNPAVLKAFDILLGCFNGHFDLFNLKSFIPIEEKLLKRGLVLVTD